MPSQPHLLEHQFFRPKLLQEKQGYTRLDYSQLEDFTLKKCGLTVNTKATFNGEIGKMCFISSPNIQAISARVIHDYNASYDSVNTVVYQTSGSKSQEHKFRATVKDLSITIQILDKNYTWNTIVEKTWGKCIYHLKNGDVSYFDVNEDNYSYTFHNFLCKLNNDIDDIVSLLNHLLINSGVKK